MPCAFYYEDYHLSGDHLSREYLRWFERARSDLLRLLGIDQRARSRRRVGLCAVEVPTFKYCAQRNSTTTFGLIENPLHRNWCGIVPDAPNRAALGRAAIEASAAGRLHHMTPGRPRRQPGRMAPPLSRLS